MRTGASPKPARTGRSPYFWAYLRRRRGSALLALGLLAVVAVLLVISYPQQDWLKGLSLNLSADLIGTIIVLYAVDPYRARAETQGDQVRDRFDRGAFIRQAADAKHQIQILELWTDMLQGNYRERFLNALRAALKQQVEIKMLLLSPDAPAAEQRADDLRRRSSVNVYSAILDNLRYLHDFIYGEIPEVFRHNIDIRVYSALPPVQMYQVDRQVVVAFYPVSVTSWNTTQYVTSADSQLGKFVGDKFDELWAARSTRTLEQFWETTVVIRSGASNAGKTGAEGDRTYRVRCVTLDEAVYVSGRNIIADHAERGISGLTARTIDSNVTGEMEERGPFSLLRVNENSATFTSLRDLFEHKYGVEHHVFLKLESASAGPPAGPSMPRPWRRGA